MHSLNIDLETFSSVNLKKSGMYKYVQSPDFEILLLGYSLDGSPVKVVDLAQGERISPILVEAISDPEVIKKAYNAAFEWYCLSKFYQTSISQWRCTMIHGLYCGYTSRLGATALAMGLPQDKQKLRVGESLIRTFCVPCEPTPRSGNRTRILPLHQPGNWEKFKEYCNQDVVAEMEIENRLSTFPLPEHEQLLWELDQQINAYGVAIDVRLMNSALNVSEEVTRNLMDEAFRISGLSNPKSVQQLSKWLTDETGEEVVDLRKDTVKDLIIAADDGVVKRMLQIRQELSKTSVKKYSAMREAVCCDGRIRGLLQHYGANRTGRWAGRLVQVQNLPQNHLKALEFARECVINKNIETTQMIYGNVPNTLSQLTRTTFVPTPGHTFYVADFSAIEARIIAWLSGEKWRLEVFATHGKIYEASASQMFGVPIELIKKGNPEYELRQKGKVAELALGYQGGKGALITMGALKQGLTEDELPEIVSRWRSANKQIVSLWYSIERAALDVMRTGDPCRIKGIVIARESEFRSKQDFLTILLPSGRKLFYVKPFISQNQFGKEALFYWGMDQETKQWKTASTYGGKLVENIVQAIARDCLAESIKRLAASGYQCVMHVHDEVVVDQPVGVGSLEEMITIMERPISWLPELQLRADGFETEFYKKD